MSRTVSITATIFATLIICISWVGCSDDTIEIVNSGAVVQNSQSGVTEYFPLIEGYSSIFEVENLYGTETVTYTVGDEVGFPGGTAIEWISYSASSGYDTGYFRPTQTALYYYENLNASPEKIIELPLITGQTWTRLSEYVPDPEEEEEEESDLVFGKDIIIDDPIDIIEDDGNGGAAKNYPTVGEISMSVQGVEVLRLSDGTVFSGTIKVGSQNSVGTWNQYWFAPGIGLVKYIVGGATVTSDSGSENGEIRSYGFKR